MPIAQLVYLSPESLPLIIKERLNTNLLMPLPPRKYFQRYRRNA